MKRVHFYFLLLIVSASLSSCGYNTMVEKRENVTSQWSQVENVYQRRADLIPNLVNTVKGYANYEQSTMEKVIKARSQAVTMNLTADDLTPEKLERFEQAQNNLSTALGRLIVESYPQLKANENFLALQSQLEGTENRITVERRRYNEVAQDYNAYIQKFPQNLIAGMFSFEKKPYFKSKPGAEEVPEVKF